MNPSARDAKAQVPHPSRNRRSQDRLPSPCEPVRGNCRPNATVECGWGRLLYAPSFDSPATLAHSLAQEAAGKRDIALHVAAPQLVLAEDQANLFLDPSLIFRRMLDTPLPTLPSIEGVVIRPIRHKEDIDAINRLYLVRGMVPLDPATVWNRRIGDSLTYLLAEDTSSGTVIGSALGVDHLLAFGDQQGGCSLWCLVADPQTGLQGAGTLLIVRLLELFAARGRTFLDLSVLHSNQSAIALYERLGFVEVPGFVVKHRNAINEKYVVNTETLERLNPYARLIVDEARLRGISADIVDAEAGIFKLRYCGQEMLCRESLTELTGGVAMTWCQDKVLTSRRLASVGLNVPRQIVAGDDDADARFLAECGSVVVKPALGEQGRGITVGVSRPEDLGAAIARAAAIGGHVVLEEFCEGQDLRIVLIGYKVVAAAIRKPATVIGDGQSTIAELIERHSAKRAAATGGESRIPVDAETERCLSEQGWSLSEVPAAGQALQVRKTANLHTGGTIHDVTSQLHPALRDVAETAARALHVPVVGLDLLVPSPDSPDYVLIEANERPGLANHEPQPTAQRFVDLLFPLTASTLPRSD